MKKDVGFTLIETLVAVTVLVIGVLGPLTIAARGISDGFFARNQITANYLAQEALETVLNLHKKTGWNDIAFCFDQDCVLVMPAGTLSFVGDCSDSALETECLLVFDKNSGFFKKLGGGIDRLGPVFKRSIRILPNTQDFDGDPSNDPDEVTVRVIIQWHNGAVLKTLSSSQILYARRN